MIKSELKSGERCGHRAPDQLGKPVHDLPRLLDVYKRQELYCPADPEDASSELVKQATPLSCVDGHNDDGHSWRQCSFTADHDGMFVIHPEGYQMQQSWPWWGVPTPPWTPSPDATTPNSEVTELQSLYASGFKFPVIGKDIHFVFPEQLKEWTEGCGDDWDYRFTAVSYTHLIHGDGGSRHSAFSKGIGSIHTSIILGAAGDKVRNCRVQIVGRRAGDRVLFKLGDCGHNGDTGKPLSVITAADA